MNMPLVSIITPCYNGELFLNQYFNSILTQTYQNLELIFVNDGSTDRTEEIALSYQPALEARGIVFKYLSQPNGGQAKAMNTGFREMTGKYLIWPDSDDTLSPDSIEKRVNFLEANPNFGFVRTNANFFSFDTGEYMHPVTYSDNRFNQDIFLDLILEETYCACGCYMIQTNHLREIYPDLKIFETSVGQNWQILIPIAGREKCGYIDEELYHIAVRKNSHSRQPRSLQEEVERRMGLKEVLEISISLSGRVDRDYQKIVHLKYQRILFQTYLKAGEYQLAKECYRALAEANVVAESDYVLYIKAFRPIMYQLHCFKQFVIRVIRKITRMLTQHS